MPNRKGPVKKDQVGNKLKLNGTPSIQGEGGGAPEGSKNHEKFKTVESKQQLFKDLIAHLEQGLDQESFIPCDWETVTRYTVQYPEIFEADAIARARRQGRQVIEKLVMSVAIGKVKGNSATVNFLAINKIGYRHRVQVDGNAKAPMFVADVPAEMAAQAYKDAMGEP